MLELQNLSFAVDDESGNKEIVQGVSLVIPDRKFVVITGPNGGGKSTLAKLVAGILKPTGGKILLDGEDITDLSITERARRGVAFAFQQPVRFKGGTGGMSGRQNPTNCFLQMTMTSNPRCSSSVLLWHHSLECGSLPSK